MKLYNTLSRKVEEFKPLTNNQVNFFVCGPTVYDYSHIGHAKTYIQLDVLARTLRHSGYNLHYLQNITDIDDKIIARAAEKQIPWQELSREFESAYYHDMETLGNTSVDQYARATDHLPEIISQVERLMAAGNAYKTADGIYFEVSTFPDYGKLSGRRAVQENDAQSRIDQSEQKRGWNDFALWKFSKPGEPTWEAPFGQGRPGWHIEDTAITEKYFGQQYDIHGGAIDLIFPHHEAELTQMEALSGKTPFVQIWVHPGFLTIDDKKMSKSLGNFFTIREVLNKGFGPMAVRLLMLQAHYRSTISFSWKSLQAAQNRLKDLHALAALRWQARHLAHDAGTFTLEEVPTLLLETLQDDLNTPGALALLSQVSTQLQTVLLEQDMLDHFETMLKGIDKLLGLQLSEVADISDEHKQMINEREYARSNQDWQKADELRDALSASGIGLRDTAEGPIWFPL